MSFVLSDQRDDPNYWYRYEAYLKSVADKFPPNAFPLATSEAWHNFAIHECPHDAWLEELRLIEPAHGERHEVRHSRLEIHLLGAYHDRKILLRYPTVFSYTLSAANCSRGMGAWRYDEFRLAENGHLIHEIEWADGSRWVIEVDDIEVQWVEVEAVLSSNGQPKATVVDGRAAADTVNS